MKILLVATLAVALVTDARALTVHPVELGEMAGASEHIVVGRIELGQLIDGDCGIRYIIRVQESLKGKFPEGSPVLFFNPAPMAIGSSYIVFLGKDPAKLTLTGSATSFGPGPSPERRRLCAKNRPRLTVSVWGTGALKISGTYETAGKVAIFDDFMVRMPEELESRKLDLARRYDTDTNVGSVDFDLLREHLKSTLPARSAAIDRS